MRRHRLDEHTETTLVRIANHRPVPPGAVDAAAAVLAKAFTDPSDPANWLERPAVRFCAHCGNRYTSRISILAAGYYCSEACAQGARDRVAELLS